MAKPVNKKTLNGNTIQLESVGKTTRQGNGRRSKPSHGRKLKRGQGK